MRDRTLALVHALWACLSEREAGVTMPEYGLILAVITLVGLIGGALMGADMSTMFENVGDTINP